MKTAEQIAAAFVRADGDELRIGNRTDPGHWTRVVIRTPEGVGSIVADLVRRAAGEALTAAVLAERERCAGVAEAMAADMERGRRRWLGRDGSEVSAYEIKGAVAAEIAQRIRKGGA